MRYDQPFCIALFDIDHFHSINEEQGQEAGDRHLQTIARMIDDNARETDIVVRYGGEEFIVVMPMTPLDGACLAAERTRFLVDSRLGLSVSCGVAAVESGDTPTAILERADEALGSAKAMGRNCVARHTGTEIHQMPRELVSAN